MSAWDRLHEAVGLPDPRKVDQVRRIVSMGRGFDERQAQGIVDKFYATGRDPKELDSLIDRYRVGGDPQGLKQVTPGQQPVGRPINNLPRAQAQQTTRPPQRKEPEVIYKRPTRR